MRAFVLIGEFLCAAACATSNSNIGGESFIRIVEVHPTTVNPHVERQTYQVLFGPMETRSMQSTALSEARHLSRDAYMSVLTELGRKTAQKELAARGICQGKVTVVRGILRFDRSPLTDLLVRCE